VREAVEQLVKLDLADETKSFALANLYRVHDLNAEAIATLEALVKRGSQTAAIDRTLGDLYLEVGLNSLAENYYMRASQLAAEAGDVEE
jgi:lipopolysaccharide biosynthesis regulator YciM